MESKIDFSDIFKNIYYNPSSPGSFGGRERLYLEAKKVNPDISKKDVKEWLSGQIVYTLHKPIRRHFKRNPVVAEYLNENFQADLIDMQEFANVNDNFKFILTVIDVFSKKAWACLIKNKSQNSVANAMELILKEN